MVANARALREAGIIDMNRDEMRARIMELEDRIRELEGERMSREEMLEAIGCLRYAADKIGIYIHDPDAVKIATARRALADHLACGLLEKGT